MPKVDDYSVWYNNLGQDPSRDPGDNNLMEFYYPYSYFYTWEGKKYAEFALKIRPDDVPGELQSSYTLKESTTVIDTLTFTLEIKKRPSNEATTQGWDILYFDWIEIVLPDGCSFDDDYSKVKIVVIPPTKGPVGTDSGGTATVRYGDIP